MVFPFTATDITIKAIVSYHLLALVRHMGAHGRQPFEGVKDLLLFSVLRLVNDFGLLWNVGHSLLGK
ncbi:hypothetical protein ES703_73546 [subsurface metagenome]